MGTTGRFRLHRRAEGAEGDLPIAWNERAWSLRLRVTAAPPPEPGADSSWDVRGVLRAGDEEVFLSDLDGFFEGAYAIARGRVARVDDGGASSWLGMLVTHRSVRITPARRAAFLEELYALPAPPLELPPSSTRATRPRGAPRSSRSSTPCPPLLSSCRRTSPSPWWMRR
jgi:hypothetical protein